MRIVVIGDLHFYSLTLRPWDLLSKRVLGQTNLWVNRRRRFRLDRIDAMVERVVGLKPETILFTGDFTTTALRDEFEQANRRLEPLFNAAPCLAVPGNHDRYTFCSARTKRFERYLTGKCPLDYPFIELLGPDLKLIALDPTRPNILTDRGELGPAQLDALLRMLNGLAPRDRLIVLCHYTIGVPERVHPEAQRHALIDAEALIAALQSDRPTLYLHGHVHHPFCWRHPSAKNVVCIDAGAPALCEGEFPTGQGFWEIETVTGNGRWRLAHHVCGDDGRWSRNEVSVPQQPGEAFVPLPKPTI